jgi:hypothetical protein
MQVLFDLQEEFNAVESLNGLEFIVPTGTYPATLLLRDADDVKTILVKNRSDIMSGVGVCLREMKEIKPGDRITITGRIPGEVPAGGWGIALVSNDNDPRMNDEFLLAQSNSPQSLFSLSYILCATDIDSMLTVQTTQWRDAIDATMDFCIDNISILREDRYSVTEEDSREVIYSFADDDNLLFGVLSKSGEPEVNFGEAEKSIHITSRTYEWDGIDINFKKLNLLMGNKYQLIVKGRIDGFAPKGTVITLECLPGYFWRNNQPMETDQFFTLKHTLGHAEIDRWDSIRVITNVAGATVPFYIYSIEIKRLGLL